MDAINATFANDGGGLDGRAVVAMQYRSLIAVEQSNAFGQRGADRKLGGMVLIIFGMHFTADDLAAVQVLYQVQVKPLAAHLCRQVGHVLAQQLPGGGGHMGLRCTLGLLVLGASSMGVLPGLFEAAAEGGFTGQVGALIGQRGHDARRWHVCKPRLVGQRQHHGALFWRERMGWRGIGRGTSGLPSPFANPSWDFQRCRVRRSMPATSQAWFKRSPSRWATSIIWVMLRRSSTWIIRPRFCGISPRAFLTAPTTLRSRPGFCLYDAASSRAPLFSYGRRPSPWG